MADYEILIDDLSGARVGQLPFEQLQMTLRFNTPGRAQISLPTSAAPVDFLVGTYRLVIRRNGTNLMSGIVSEARRRWDGGQDTLNLDVEDDLALLAARLIVPVPLGPPYNSASHDVRTGPIETIMHQYVAWHAGANARAERRIPGLTQAADQARGATVTARGRFVPLLGMLQYLADLGGFGFSLAGMQFQIYEPQVSSARFSREMNNLINFERGVRQPDVNFVYVGGSGQLENRIIVENWDFDSIQRWGRLEGWRDQRNLSDSAELQNVAARALAERMQAAETIRWSAETTLDSIGLGQRVTVAFDGAEYTDIVREIRVETDGVSEHVVVASNADAPRIFQRLDAVENSLRLLEVQ
ncbi:MAG: hypothetical protein WHV44_00245 [Anaerolineales bacterium]